MKWKPYQTSEEEIQLSKGVDTKKPSKERRSDIPYRKGIRGKGTRRKSNRQRF
jgi:hypothetical protein